MDFRKIAGFPDYEINRAGDVVSLRSGIRKPVKPDLSLQGYLTVKLAGADKYCTKHVHRLVAEAFLPGCLPGLVVNHKDGNKLNNSPENLEWATHRRNLMHSIHVLGRVNFPVLEFDDAERMRHDRRCGMKYRELAAKYGVSQSIVYSVLSNRTYKDEGLFQRRKRTPIKGL